MGKLPADLVPLDSVNNERNAEAVMAAIERAWRMGQVELWGYEGNFSPTLKPVPADYAIVWMAGPGRENGDHPEYPGLAYYCDAGASLRLREDVPGGYLPRAGMASTPIWTQVRISQRELGYVRRDVQRAHRQARPTDAELDEWMKTNAPRWVKRDLIIGQCRQEMGATVRAAAAAYNRLPAGARLKRGEKPGKKEIER